MPFDQLKGLVTLVKFAKSQVRSRECVCSDQPCKRGCSRIVQDGRECLFGFVKTTDLELNVPETGLPNEACLRHPFLKQILRNPKELKGFRQIALCSSNVSTRDIYRTQYHGIRSESKQRLGDIEVSPCFVKVAALAF